MPSDDSRRDREIKAALKQIRKRQTRTSRRWYLDTSAGRLALEGIAVFVLAFFVGRGMALLFQVLRDFISG